MSPAVAMSSDGGTVVQPRIPLPERDLKERGRNGRLGAHSG
jgi:hypothetical protein